MNFGDCPYDDCDGFIFYAVPDRTPAYARFQCDKCHRWLWYKFSRLDPEAWTEDDFLKAHTVDESTHEIAAK